MTFLHRTTYLPQCRRPVFITQITPQEKGPLHNSFKRKAASYRNYAQHAWEKLLQASVLQSFVSTKSANEALALLQCPKSKHQSTRLKIFILVGQTDHRGVV